MAGPQGRDQALAILCPSQTFKDKDTDTCGLAATHCFLWDVELKPNPPASLGLFPCGCHINSKTIVLTDPGTTQPDCQPLSQAFRLVNPLLVVHREKDLVNAWPAL